MNEQEFNSAIQKYDSFREELKRKAENKEISRYPKECYLIKETWIIDFIKSFNNYQSNSQSTLRFRWKSNKINSL